MKNQIVSLFDSFEAMKSLGYEIITFELHLSVMDIIKLMDKIPNDTIVFDVESLNMSMHTNLMRFLYKGDIDELLVVLNNNDLEVENIKDGLIWIKVNNITDIQEFLDFGEKIK
jgi:hypothetical protein